VQAVAVEVAVLVVQRFAMVLADDSKVSFSMSSCCIVAKIFAMQATM
jgi:hypothetical protein